MNEIAMMRTVKELSLYKAPNGRKVIVIGPHVYGIGLTGAEAYRLAGKPKEWYAYDCHGLTVVSHFNGGLSVSSEDNTEKQSAEELFVLIGEKISK